MPIFINEAVDFSGAGHVYHHSPVRMVVFVALIAKLFEIARKVGMIYC